MKLEREKKESEKETRKFLKSLVTGSKHKQKERQGEYSRHLLT
jgi:hypothetical protein